MEIKNLLIILAAAEYGCDAYGANAYGKCSSSTNTGTDSGTTSPPASGGLVDTGWNILLPLALGLAIIIASVILLIKRWRRKQS